MVGHFGGGGRGGMRRIVSWRLPPYSLVLKLVAGDVESGVCYLLDDVESGVCGHLWVGVPGYEVVEVASV
jgi:hypothetical protein